MFDRVRSILDINNSFFQFGRKILWVFVLNIIFIVTSLPVITMGASMTAMNSVFVKIINEREFSVLKDYFQSFKVNFIKSTVVWVISLVLGFILYIDIFYWAAYGIQDGTYGYVMLVMSSLAALFFIMMLHTVFPLISRFDMTLKELIVNTVLITARDCLYCVEAVASTLLVVGFSFYMIYTGRLLIMIYMVFLCFGLNGLIQSYIYRRVLNKYSEDYIEMVKRVQKELKEQGFEE